MWRELKRLRDEQTLSNCKCTEVRIKMMAIEGHQNENAAGDHIVGGEGGHQEYTEKWLIVVMFLS